MGGRVSSLHTTSTRCLGPAVEPSFAAVLLSLHRRHLGTQRLPFPLLKNACHVCDAIKDGRDNYHDRHVSLKRWDTFIMNSHVGTSPTSNNPGFVARDVILFSVNHRLFSCFPWSIVLIWVDPMVKMWTQSAIPSFTNHCIIEDYR